MPAPKKVDSSAPLEGDPERFRELAAELAQDGAPGFLSSEAVRAEYAAARAAALDETGARALRVPMCPGREGALDFGVFSFLHPR